MMSDGVPLLPGIRPAQKEALRRFMEKTTPPTGMQTPERGCRRPTGHCYAHTLELRGRDLRLSSAGFV